MTFGEKISDLCKEKGIKMARLEADLGFSHGYVRTLKDKLPTDRAAKITEYLGLPSDYFMPKESKKSPASQNPIIEKIVVKASTLTESEQKELLSYTEYILSKH